jgi:hypothetical protein
LGNDAQKLRSAGVPPAVVAASRAATWGGWESVARCEKLRPPECPAGGDAATTAGGDAGAPKEFVLLRWGQTFVFRFI